MEVFIKNMVCDRCIMVVNREFEKIGVYPVSIKLGKVEVEKDLSKDQLTRLEHSLEQLGFELLGDKRSKLIENIKSIIIQLVHHPSGEKTINLSQSITKELHLDYSYLSGLFSEMEHTTIEKYFIRQKIERAKELVMYDEHSISQVADILGYSSVAHLSNQFKQVTGYTPTQFKKLPGKRKPLDKV